MRRYLGSICVVIATFVPATWADTSATAAQSLDPFEAVASMPCAQAPREGRVVTVCTAKGEPAAEAIVVALDWSATEVLGEQASAERIFPGDEPRILARMATRGTRYPVGADGTAIVPSDAEGIVALRGERVAATLGMAGMVPDTEHPVTLTPASARSFSVTVRQHDGSPAAGVLVGLSLEPRARPFAGARTDTDGRVDLRALIGREPAVHVLAAVATRIPLAADLPHEDGADVQLQLPPCVRVRAELIGDVVPGSSTTWTLFTGNDGGREELVSDDPHTVLFERFEVGVPGAVACVNGQRRWFSTGIGSATVDGDLQVAIRYWGPLLAMRVLDVDGQPARQASVLICFKNPSGRAIVMRDETNREGWLELDVPDDLDDGSRMLVELRSGGEEDVLLGYGGVQIERIDGVRTVLGDLEMTPPVVALRGTIVDQGGTAIDGVMLEVAGPDHRYYATTASDGSFTISMPEPLDEDSRLVVRSPWYLASSDERSISIASGTEDARVVVRAVGRVLVHAPGLPRPMAHSFAVDVEPANESTAPLPNGEVFDLDELVLPEGTWHLVLAVQGTEVGRIENVQVSAGAETRDARLLELDWPRLASLVTIRLEDEHGEPSDAAEVRYSTSGIGSMACGRPRNGVAHVLVPKESAPLFVSPRDQRCLPVPVDPVAGVHVIRIGAGATVLVQMPVLPELPPGAELLIGLESPVARHLSSTMLRVMTIGQDRFGVSFNVARPGDYIVKLALARGNRRSTLEWTLGMLVESEDLTVDIVPDSRFMRALERASGR